MKITDVLSESRIIPEIRATRRDDAIAELSACLVAGLDGVKQADVVRALLDREQQGSTAIEHGIAIPHGKLAAADRLAACLGRSRKGIDFGSTDGARSHIVFAVIAPANAAGSHLKLLACFSRIFSGAAFRERLTAAATAADMYRIVAEEEAR